MTRIAYILLAHRNPSGVIAQVRQFADQGDAVAVHFDRNARRQDWQRLRTELADCPSLVFARRVRCGWGEWSLVQATLNALTAALKAFPDATHFVMLSGDCSPIKPRAVILRDLEGDDRDRIENHDFFDSDWIRTGLKEERLIYRHFVNERTRKWLFYLLLEGQRRLGLTRALPVGIRVRIGSQWWMLRRKTVERVMRLLDTRPDLIRFFRTTWIPDETFFQTLVPHVTPRDQVENHPPTLLAFSDYGMPVVFHDDHYDLLVGQREHYARKLAPGATALRARLSALHAAPVDAVPTGGATARGLIRYLTGRGREGRRSGERVWNRLASIGAEHELLLVACKKWHVAKRLSAAIGTATGLPAYGYVFDETEAGLPDLGNAGSSPEKRGRHRRAFLRLIFDTTRAPRLLICVDSGKLDVIADFARDACRLTVLDLATRLDDDWLRGHAGRVGLTATGPLSAELLPSLQRQFAEEAEGLRSLGLPRLTRLAEADGQAPRAAALAAFLGVTEGAAQGILAATDLFA